MYLPSGLFAWIAAVLFSSGRGSVAEVSHRSAITSVEYLGRAEFPVGLPLNDSHGGRLDQVSGIAFLPGSLTDALFLSDDGLIFTVAINLTDGSHPFGVSDIRFGSEITLKPDPASGVHMLDSEGIVVLPTGPVPNRSAPLVWVSTEPNPSALSRSPVNIETFDLGTGAWHTSPFILPSLVHRGTRTNKGFESLSAAPGTFIGALCPSIHKHHRLRHPNRSDVNSFAIVTATEQAVSDDGPQVRRLLQFNACNGGPPVRAVGYLADLVEAHDFSTASFGLVELSLLDGNGLFGGQLLALERKYDARIGNTVRLYLVDTDDTDDVRQCPHLTLNMVASHRGAEREQQAEKACENVRFARKTLLMEWSKSGMHTLDGSSFDVRVDNYEAMALVPEEVVRARMATHASGTDNVRKLPRLLLLANDDNINLKQIGTQLVLLALHQADGSSSSAATDKFEIKASMKDELRVASQLGVGGQVITDDFLDRGHPARVAWQSAASVTWLVLCTMLAVCLALLRSSLRLQHDVGVAWLALARPREYAGLQLHEITDCAVS